MGFTIISFRLDELSYAPEVANVMLKKQSAKAMVEARKVIVDGAVSLSKMAMLGLKEKGIQLSAKQTGDLISNLLTVLCSPDDESNAPTVNTVVPEKNSSFFQ